MQFLTFSEYDKLDKNNLDEPVTIIEKIIAWGSPEIHELPVMIIHKNGEITNLGRFTEYE